MPKRALAVPALLLLPLAASACGSNDTTTAADTTTTAVTTTAATTAATSAPAGQCSYPAGGPSSKTATPPPAAPTVSGTVHATVKTSIGTMKFSLDAKHAPCTVNSFVSLAKQGYFDNTPCHRMTTSPGFQVLQCGDPTGTGSGGPGYTIPDEITGSEKYTAGTLAMANTGQANSGGSQFFIVYGDTQLNPAYTVFGKVDRATIKEITKAAKAGVVPQMSAQDGTPKTKITIQSVATS